MLSSGTHGDIFFLNKKNSGAPRPRAFLFTVSIQRFIPFEYATRAERVSES